MKAPVWVLSLVFLGVSIPTVLLMHRLEIGGDYRLMIAIGAGALATALVQAGRGRRKE